LGLLTSSLTSARNRHDLRRNWLVPKPEQLMDDLFPGRSQTGQNHRKMVVLLGLMLTLLIGANGAIQN